MEGQNGIEYGEGRAPQGGDDHGKRAGQIAGQAVAALLDRLVYLEAIVSDRERQVADMDEQVQRLKCLHSDAVERGAEGFARLDREHRRLQRVALGLEDAARGAEAVLIDIHNRAQGQALGRRSQPIKNIPSHTAELMFQARQAGRFRNGYSLEYSGFPDAAAPTETRPAYNEVM